MNKKGKSAAMFLRLSMSEYINVEFVKYFKIQRNHETNLETIPPTKIVQYVIAYNLTDYDNEEKWLPQRFRTEEEAQIFLQDIMSHIHSVSLAKRIRK